MKASKRGSFTRKLGFVLCFLLILFVVSSEGALVPEGAFRGTFIGDRYGSFVLAVDRDGYVSGELFFNKTTTSVPLVGTCSMAGTCELQALEGAMVFRGRVDQFDRFIGRWLFNGGEERGSFYGMKQ